MSLIVTYHTKDFGIVCSDGRVSLRLPDGRFRAVLNETVRKFIVLRASPALVLAGSSSISKWLDFSVCDAMRRFIENFPEASFDQVAGTIGPTVYEARSAFRIFSGAPRPAEPLSWIEAARKSIGKMGRMLDRRWPRKNIPVKALAALSGSPRVFTNDDGNFLNLLGFDPERRRIRNRVFSCTERCDEWERENGVTIEGFCEPDEAFAFAGKFLELVGRERGPKPIVQAMRSIAAEIEASYPETIGAPYFFHLVTKGLLPASRDIEEQFRQAVSTEIHGHAARTQHDPEMQLRTAVTRPSFSLSEERRPDI
jgi:hypothetical protein